VTLLGYNTDAFKKNTETLSDTSKQVSLKVDAEETKHILLCIIIRRQGKIMTKRPSENVAQSIYLEKTVTNQHFILKKIKMKLNSGNT
jgi:hypothetical protein